jgi:hypothetical protein
MADLEGMKPQDVQRGLPTEQSPTAPPVIFAPHFPAMEKIGEVKTGLRNPLLPLMGGVSLNLFALSRRRTSCGFIEATR